MYPRLYNLARRTSIESGPDRQRRYSDQIASSSGLEGHFSLQSSDKLLVTSAEVETHQLDAVESYLVERWDPLIEERFPDVAPIEVNLHGSKISSRPLPPRTLLNLAQEGGDSDRQCARDRLAGP